MSLFRSELVHNPPSYQGGEFPQTQYIMGWGQQHRVCGRTQQSLPSSTQVPPFRYACQYLDSNNISSIADIKKAYWPNFSFISLGKSVLIKMQTK